MELNSYIDHTNLKADATAADIEKLCAEARQYRFASVCVNAGRVELAKKLLAGSGVKVCTVIGFPLGATTTETKAAEVESAYRLGCEEFDMVLDIGALRDGNDTLVRGELAALVSAAKGRTVKVIIETGLLTDAEKIKAVELACAAGANFVKTCTGFNSGVATEEDVRLMKQHVTGGVKIKASAGIRDRAKAEALIAAGADRLGTSAGVAIVSGPNA